MAASILAKEEVIRDFLSMDYRMSEIMVSNGTINEIPPELDSCTFDIDITVEEGDVLDLGAGVAWTIYNTPGHSPCQIALHDKKEGTLVIADATGFHVPHIDAIWPNYFQSLELYCDSIRKLFALSAERLVLGHHGVIDGRQDYLPRAMRATEAYHQEMLERTDAGEDPKEIAQEKAEWVRSLTDIVPIETMYYLSTILIKRSQSVGNNESLFAIR
jgi:glyoxylase-like metal-dependent hydrolase (beta-lactamase superfamily II)